MARDERGSLAPAVPIIAIMLLALAGLGIDGSRQLNARGEAVAYAEEAARAGAQAVDLDSAELALVQQSSPGKQTAEDRVNDYCKAVIEAQPGVVTYCKMDGPITAVSDDDPRKIVVHVLVRTKIKTTLLGITGFSELNASGKGSARPYEGVTNPYNYAPAAPPATNPREDGTP